MEVGCYAIETAAQNLTSSMSFGKYHENFN